MRALIYTLPVVLFLTACGDPAPVSNPKPAPKTFTAAPPPPPPEPEEEELSPALKMLQEQAAQAVADHEPEAAPLPELVAEKQGLYEQKAGEIDSAFEEKMATLISGYQTGLVSLRSSYKDAGNLTVLLLIEEEQKRSVEDPGALLLDTPADFPDRLRTWRLGYQRMHAQAAKERGERLQKLNQAYLVMLEKIVKHYLVKNEVDAAMATRDEAKRIEALVASGTSLDPPDPVIPDVPDTPVQPPGSDVKVVSAGDTRTHTWSGRSGGSNNFNPYEANRIYLLAGVAGNFRKATDFVGLELQGRDWSWVGKPDPSLTGFSGRSIQLVLPSSWRVTGPPVFKTWDSKKAKLKLIHKSEGICFLSGIGGTFNGGKADLRLRIAGNDYWYLDGETGAEGVSATVGIWKFPRRYPKIEVIEHEFDPPRPGDRSPIKLLEPDEGVAVFCGVKGHLAGGGESVYLKLENGAYYMKGQSMQSSLRGYFAEIRLR